MEEVAGEVRSSRHQLYTRRAAAAAAARAKEDGEDVVGGELDAI